MLKYLKERFHYIKNRFVENDIDNVIWIVDILPKLGGFSLEMDEVRR